MELTKDDFRVFRDGGYAEQVAQGFRPRTDIQPVPLRFPLDWDMDPFHDRNWRFQLHAWRMLDPIWGEFYGKDWDRLRVELLPSIRDWHAYHIERKLKAVFSWYDMSAGSRAQHLALLGYLHKKGLMPLPPKDLAVVRRLSAEHVKRLRNPAYIAMGNHGLFQIKGLRLLGVAWEGEDFCAGELEYSTQMMERLLHSQFDERGAHTENSPYYHSFVLKQFSAIRTELFPEISSKLESGLAKPREVLPWFTFPDRSMAAIGDSAGMGSPLSSDAEPDFTLETAAGGPIWIRDLAASGYVVVRSARDVDADKASMMVVKGQTRSNGHLHADQLSFILYRAGRHLLADSGKYSYNHDAWRAYFLSDRAHNVVGLLGKGFAPPDTVSEGPCLNGVSVADGAVVVEGEIERGGFFKHSRRIVYRPEESIEVSDRIQARPQDVPVVYWHVGTGVDAERVEGGVELFDNGKRLARIGVADREVKARLVHGQEKPRIQGWISASYKQKTASTVIEFRAPAGCSQIDTHIELFKAEALQPGVLPRCLCHGIRLPFPFEFRADRIRVLPDGRTSRKVTVGIPAAAASTAANRLANAMAAKGFEIERRVEEGNAVEMLFRHDDRTEAAVVLNQPSGATATLTFSWQKLPLKPVADGSQDNPIAGKP